MAACIAVTIATASAQTGCGSTPSGPVTLTSSSGTLTPTPGAGTSVVINEFASRTSDNEACGEFVELRNDSSVSVPIGNWRILSYRTTSGTTDTYHTIEAGRVLEPGCHYLIATDVYAANPGAVTRDAGSSCGLDDNSGLALMNSTTSSIVDQVGMSASSIYKEGTALAQFPSSPPRVTSYGRTGIDTNNNASDFTLQFPATPQNSTSSCAER